MALTDKFNEEWNGFKGRLWKEEVNTRQFIQDNYKPYDGDESFLADPTEATNKLWGKLQKLQKEERAKGGVLECETMSTMELTTAVTAEPITTPTAISIIDPRDRNFLKSFNGPLSVKATTLRAVPPVALAKSAAIFMGLWLFITALLTKFGHFTCIRLVSHDSIMPLVGIPLYHCDVPVHDYVRERRQPCLQRTC